MSTCAAGIFTAGLISLAMLLYAPDAIIMDSEGFPGIPQDKSKPTQYRTSEETTRLMQEDDQLDSGEGNPFHDEPNELTI